MTGQPSTPPEPSDTTPSADPPGSPDSSAVDGRSADCRSARGEPGAAVPSARPSAARDGEPDGARCPHVLITGAASGIGAATALEFARRLTFPGPGPVPGPVPGPGPGPGQAGEPPAHGGTLSLVDIDPDGLATTADRLREEAAGTAAGPTGSPGASAAPAAGWTVATHTVDLTEADGPQSAVEHAWTAHGPVDILVNAAGAYPSLDMMRVTAEQWDRLFALNTRAPALATAELARRATSARRGACVVNISSGAALRSRPGGGPYASSKAALEMATRAAALELGPYGIRVNAVSPGFIPVDSAANPVAPEYAEAVSVNPLGRPGSPDDVARAVRWIAGPEAGWITGEVLRVDGGSSTGALSLPRIWPPGQEPPHHPASPASGTHSTTGSTSHTEGEPT